MITARCRARAQAQQIRKNAEEALHLSGMKASSQALWRGGGGDNVNIEYLLQSVSAKSLMVLMYLPSLLARVACMCLVQQTGEKVGGCCRPLRPDGPWVPSPPRFISQRCCCETPLI